MTDTAAHARRRRAPQPPVPPFTRHIGRLGVSVALLAAATLSFQPLTSLAHWVGWPKEVAWLLPVALDVYAATSIAVGYGLPANHRARVAAMRNSRFALALTLTANGAYHLVATGQLSLQWWGILPVSLLPIIAAERLIHLGMHLNGAAETTAETGSGSRVEPLPARRGTTTTGAGESKTPAAPTTSTVEIPVRPRSSQPGESSGPTPAKATPAGGSESAPSGGGGGPAVAEIEVRAREVETLLGLMRERGGAKKVSLNEVETILGLPSSTAARRLNKARKLYAGESAGTAPRGSGTEPGAALADGTDSR